MATTKAPPKSYRLVTRSGRELAETPGLIRVREAGNVLQMCDAQIYTLAKAGVIPSYKIGRRRLFKLDELNDWITGKRQELQQQAA